MVHTVFGGKKSNRITHITKTTGRFERPVVNRERATYFTIREGRYRPRPRQLKREECLPVERFRYQRVLGIFYDAIITHRALAGANEPPRRISV